MFEPWGSYDEFYEAWKNAALHIPLDLSVVYLRLLSCGTKHFIAKIPKDSKYIVHNTTRDTIYGWRKRLSDPDSYARRVYYGCDWKKAVLYAEIFEIDPLMIVNENAFKSEKYTVIGSNYWYRPYKILFTAYQQGIPLKDLVPEWYHPNLEQAKREWYFSKYHIMLYAGATQTSKYYTYKKRMHLYNALCVAEKLGIPIKDLFIDETPKNRTAFGMTAQTLGKLDEVDSMFVYAVGYLLANGVGATDDGELEDALRKLIVKRNEWRNIYRAKKRSNTKGTT